MRRIRFLALIGFALAACGDGGSSDTDSTSPGTSGSAGAAGSSAGTGGTAGAGGGTGGDAGNGGAGKAGAAGGPGGGAANGGAGAGGAGASGGTGGAAGKGGSSGASGQAGAPASCGGKLGTPCAPGAFCNLDGTCGAGDQTGTCEPLPGGCTADCPGVCGCNGVFYCNACGAHMAGVSVSKDASCKKVDCAALSEKLVPELQIVGACTVVVRLAYTDKAVLGYAVRCGKYAATTEETARKEAAAATGFGATSPLISGPDPQDEFVFFQAPADIGDVAAVHRRSGLAVFGGSIIGLGKGDISFPKQWRPASELGSGCSGGITPAPARGYDLRDGKELAAEDVQGALGVVWQTAVPLAMAKANYVFDAMVLLYPRSVFGFDPTTAEWIVLVNGGWLE